MKRGSINTCCRRAFYRAKKHTKGTNPEGNVCGDAQAAIEDYTVADLKELLKARGQKHTGRKDELISRLKALGETDELASSVKHFEGCNSQDTSGKEAPRKKAREGVRGEHFSEISRSGNDESTQEDISGGLTSDYRRANYDFPTPYERPVFSDDDDDGEESAFEEKRYDFPTPYERPVFSDDDGDGEESAIEEKRNGLPTPYGRPLFSDDDSGCSRDIRY